MRILAILLLMTTTALAQFPLNRPTTNGSVTITLGNTFQTALAARADRQSLTVQNNNTTTDSCWVFLGAGTATKALSILLLPGGAYTRYYPYVPTDVVQVTCATTNNTVYVDTN